MRAYLAAAQDAAVCLAVLGAAACWAPRAAAKEPTMSLTLTSPAFAQSAAMPERYTCEGPDVSPPLAWSGVPAGTRSLALIVDDPDAPDPAAPTTAWVHWVLYNIAQDAPGLPENASGSALAGARAGLNDWQHARYNGPCPPIGRHRYFLKLYALDTTLPDLGKSAGKAALEKAMQGHVLARAELVGTYKKH
jgi:Raf kinase inhibitor-like YbhB/YbcL family protein